MNRDVGLHLQRWPKMCRAWERAIKATYDSSKTGFATSEEYWQWWLNRDGKMLIYKDELLFRDSDSLEIS